MALKGPAPVALEGGLAAQRGDAPPPSADSRSVCNAASRWPSRQAETPATRATAMPTDASTSTVSLARIEPLRRRVGVCVDKLGAGVAEYG